MDITANPATILLADDDESVRRLVRQVLLEEGFLVLEAADGEQALQVAAGYDLSLDLLLTDVMMPNVNGLVLAERLSLERPGIRVLYMSGHVEKRIVIAKHPDVQILHKPFAPAALIAVVRRMLPEH
jgi:two-component system cell cycle sensor histidine kinase/response regulator CckA